MKDTEAESQAFLPVHPTRDINVLTSRMQKERVTFGVSVLLCLTSVVLFLATFLHTPKLTDAACARHLSPYCE